MTEDDYKAALAMIVELVHGQVKPLVAMAAEKHGVSDDKRLQLMFDSLMAASLHTLACGGMSLRDAAAHLRLAAELTHENSLRTGQVAS